MKRVVLDINVFVSSVLGKRLGIILDFWKTRKFTLIVSNEILDEYLEVMARPKFHLPQQVITEISAFLFAYAEFVIPAEAPFMLSRMTQVTINLSKLQLPVRQHIS